MTAPLLTGISNSVLKFRTFIDSYFGISRSGSKLSTEILAGTATYLSLAFIFIVNPIILGRTHIPLGAVTVASIVASALSTLLMGLVARLPFAVGPGIEMNILFAYVMFGTLRLSWQEGLAAVFWAGLLCILVGVIIARWPYLGSAALNRVPPGLSRGITISVGVFVAITGLFVGHVVDPSSAGHVIDFQNWSATRLLSPTAGLLYLGLIAAIILDWSMEVPGGVIITILITTFVAWKFSIGARPTFEQVTLTSATRDIGSVIRQIDFLAFLSRDHFRKIAASCIALVCIQFYGGLGKYITFYNRINANVAARLQLEPSELRRQSLYLETEETVSRPIFIDGLGTLVGSLLGTSSLITYVESIVGIEAGGTTGLSAVTCATLMLASFWVTSLLTAIPAEATSGILVYILFLLLFPKSIKSHQLVLRWPTVSELIDILITTIMATVSFIYFSLCLSIRVGMLLYVLRDRQRNYWLVFAALPLVFSTLALTS